MPTDITDDQGDLLNVQPGGSIPTVLGLADTLVGSGSTAAAPVAGTAIASIAAPGAGVYRIEALVWQSGTPDTNLLNARIFHGAAPVGGGSIPTLSTPQKITFDRVTVAAGEAISLLTGLAAGGAGAVYNGVITITKLTN